LLGRVALERRRYHDPEVGGVVPVDPLIDAAARTLTLGVGELACRLAIDSASFERAAANLLQAAGLQISAEMLRQLVEHEGQLLLQAQRSEQLELDFSAGDCSTTQTPDGRETTRVYVSADGVQVPVVTDVEKQRRRTQAHARRKRLRRRKGHRRPPLPACKRGADQRYKEFKIVTLYDQEHAHRYVRATRKDHREAGRLLRRGAAELRLQAACQRVGIADGAEWIWKQMDQNLDCLDGKVLDFYHLSEHVHAARRGVFGEEDPAGVAWAGQVLHTVRHEGYQPFWGQLIQQRAAVRSPAKRAALDDLLGYVAARQGLLDYPRCAQRGWDIGSGSMESMCKALTRRLKQRGMRWDMDHAEAMMALETLEQTQGWKAWRRCRAAMLN
jgi:hypothetical protein